MSRTTVVAAVLSIACASCSYAFVRGPSATAASVERCTESDLLPSGDAAIGALVVAGAVGGEFYDQLKSPITRHYALYLGLPLLVGGIALLVSASDGTDKVERCRLVRHGGPTRGCDGCPFAVP